MHRPVSDTKGVLFHLLRNLNIFGKGTDRQRDPSVVFRFSYGETFTLTIQFELAIENKD